MSDLAVRHWFLGLIAAFYESGKTTEANAVASFAKDLGVWVHSDQRPLHYVPGLTAKPVHDAREFPVASYLNQHGAVIRNEVMGSVYEKAVGLYSVEEKLVDHGIWNVLPFYEDGVRNVDACLRFPRTAKLIDESPTDLTKAGVVALSWLAPGTHIRAHCGLTNARLRLHYPLSVDDHARMRVSDITFRWDLGQTVVFDDSFEHEVWHDGEAPRLILLADFFHPELSSSDADRLSVGFNVDANLKISRFLRGTALRSLSMSSTSSFNVEFEAEQDKRIRRLLATIKAEKVRISEGGQIVIDSPSN